MADNSSQSITDLQNDFGLEPNLMQCTLKMIAFYEARNFSKTGQDYGLSFIIAKHVIEKIITDGANQLYGNYLDQQLNAHAIHMNSDLLDSVFAMEYLPKDETLIEVSCDQEPDLQIMDNWSRYRVISNSKQNHEVASIHLKSSQSWHGLSDREHEGRKIFEKARERAIKHLRDIDKHKLPQPVDLSRSEPTNRVEDQLRRQKEYDILKRENEEIQQKNIQEQVKEQKLKIQRALTELKKKNYTFDYDGKLIVCKAISFDKFPPAAFLVELGVSEGKKPADKHRRETKRLSVEEVKELARITPTDLNADRGGDQKLKRKSIFQDKDESQIMKDHHPSQIWDSLQPKKPADKHRRETKRLSVEEVKDLARITPRDLNADRGGDQKLKRKSIFQDKDESQIMKDHHPSQIWDSLQPKKPADQHRREIKKLSFEEVKELVRITPRDLNADRGGDQKLKRKSFFQDKDASQIMKDYHPPQIWDSLQPKEGVLFQEGLKQKKGPNFSGTTSNEDSKKTPLRMTRQEYNLRMTRLIVSKSLMTGSLNKTQTFQNSKNPAMTFEEPKMLLIGSTLPQPRASSEIKERTSVKIHSSKFLEALHSREDPLLTSIDLPYSARIVSNRAKSDLSRFIQETTMSIPTENDQFNMKILNYPEWGKSPIVNASQTPIALPKSKHSMRASIGRTSKLPRDRNMQQTFYASKGFNLSNRSIKNIEF